MPSAILLKAQHSSGSRWRRTMTAAADNGNRRQQWRNSRQQRQRTAAEQRSRSLQQHCWRHNIPVVNGGGMADQDPSATLLKAQHSSGWRRQNSRCWRHNIPVVDGSRKTKQDPSATLLKKQHSSGQRWWNSGAGAFSNTAEGTTFWLLEPNEHKR